MPASWRRSYLLHLRPDLVHMDRAQTGDGLHQHAQLLHGLDRGRPADRQSTLDRRHGDRRLRRPDACYCREGQPRGCRRPSAEKVELLKEVRQQHTRRKARRGRTLLRLTLLRERSYNKSVLGPTDPPGFSVGGRLCRHPAKEREAPSIRAGPSTLTTQVPPGDCRS